MSSIVAPEIGPGRARLIGILCIVGAMVLFTVTDVSIKLLSGGYALHQIVLIRSLIGLVMLLGLILPLRGGYAVLRTRRLQLHALRGMLVVAANMLFFAALAVMPLADAVAISFVSPLAITVLSVLLLKESVGPRRWAAIFPAPHSLRCPAPGKMPLGYEADRCWA